jgi:predicted lipoprotein
VFRDGYPRYYISLRRDLRLHHGKSEGTVCSPRRHCDAIAEVEIDASVSDGDPQFERRDASLAPNVGDVADAALSVDAGAERSVCGSPPVSTSNFSRRALREAAVDCALYHFCEFNQAALKLETSLDAWERSPGSDELSLARRAWLKAMENWSTIEFFQFGPLASNSASAGKDMEHGRGLRDRIYSWPLVARCRVEEQLESQRYENGLDTALVSGRGLFGIEYLLHYSGDDTACSPASVTATGWTQIGSKELAVRKRDYALALGRDVRERAAELLDVYSPTGENFRKTFIDAEGYMDEQQAMNVLAWALVYLEREVKDYKVGIPAGYTVMSPVTTAEAAFSEAQTLTLRANLRGFRSLFQGCGEQGEGLGFDDWLSESKHGDLASDIISALDRATEYFDTLPAWPNTTEPQLNEAYLRLKALTDLLKTEFFGAGSPLNLEFPATLEGDTD